MLAVAASSPRNYCILKLFQTTGMRLGGLTSLRLRHLNLDSPNPQRRRQIEVTEKFSKQRTVFIDEPTLLALLAWLAVRPVSPTDHLFVSSSGQPLTLSAVSQIVRRIGQRAGVTEPCSPHQWRHRFARRLAENGMPLGQISQILGHSDVSTTVKHYGIFAIGELQNNYDKYLN
jgi:site-specific recombinase XerD